jgi:hypothetical protein
MFVFPRTDRGVPVRFRVIALPFSGLPSASASLGEGVQGRAVRADVVDLTLDARAGA